jgi:hypothetical protein
MQGTMETAKAKGLSVLAVEILSKIFIISQRLWTVV